MSIKKAKNNNVTRFRFLPAKKNFAWPQVAIRKVIAHEDYPRKTTLDESERSAFVAESQLVSRTRRRKKVL